MSLFGQNIAALMASHGYLLLWVIVLLEEAGVPLPIPGDLLLLFAGSLVAQGVLSFVLTIAVVVVATLAGTSVLYSLARHGGRPLLRRYGRWLRIKGAHLDRAERWLDRRPVSGVVMLRLIPGLRIYSTVAAGVLAVPRLRATASFVVSGGVWAGTWVGLGVLLGPRVGVAAQMIRRVDGLFRPLLLTILVLGGVVLLGRWLAHQHERARVWSTAKGMHLLNPLTIGMVALALLLLAVPFTATAHTVGGQLERDPDFREVFARGHRVEIVYDRLLTDFF